MSEMRIVVCPILKPVFVLWFQRPDRPARHHRSRYAGRSGFGRSFIIVEFAVPFRDRFVHVVGEGPFGEVIVPETRDTTSAAAFGRASRRTACRIRSNRSLSDRRESIL